MESHRHTGPGSGSSAAGSKDTACAGVLNLKHKEMTAGTIRHIELRYNVNGKAELTTEAELHPVYPKWDVVFTLPKGIPASIEDEVSVIGMDKRKLAPDEISADGTTVTLRELELQPNNGIDVLLYLNAKVIPPVCGSGYTFAAASAVQGKGFSQGTGTEQAILTSVSTVSDLKRVIPVERYSEPDYTRTQLSWITPQGAEHVSVELSDDRGASWKEASFTTQQRIVTADDVDKIQSISGQLVDRRSPREVVELDRIVVGLHEIPEYPPGTQLTIADVSNLGLNRHYMFRLRVTGGDHAGLSNTAAYFTGTFNIVDYGAIAAERAEDAVDNTEAIQAAMDAAAASGGGTVYVPPGIFGQGTIHLRSHVYLYLAPGSVLWGLSGAIDDRGVRLNQYQDGGHSFHHSAMFYGLRLDNIKIIGTGTIHGGTCMRTGDPASGSGLADKQVSITLCTNYEFGGYGAPEGTYELSDKTDKLIIQRVGHFQLLSGGVDYIDIHDVYVADEDTEKQYEDGRLLGYVGGKYSNRDIFDLMSDSYVSITNIYAEFAADDIVKLGSDYALGFVRHSGHYRVDRIEAWTWCNLFQIGSETVGDISNIHVSNITVHQAEKSGFSISTNDGTVVSNLLLDGSNEMTGTKTPITMTISNRGRRPGGPEAALVGGINRVTLKNIRITEARGIKSGETWAPTISGYFNEDTGVTHYAEHIALENISLVTKAAHPIRTPAQVSMGQEPSDPVKDAVVLEMPTRYPSAAGNYNVPAPGQRPAYGLYARHIKHLTIRNMTAAYEDGHDDGRYAVVLDDVIDADIDRLNLPKFSAHHHALVKTIRSAGIQIANSRPLEDTNGTTELTEAEYPALHE
ncbi:glycosyl hydrolase family 28-related protein [Paenibacillus sp. NPDC056579]|uniref:glycosyl hydrolase family 28-related protein n=1 Tax=Paenibacillus sp. NPDC056579 TaxID=3345871 RepID=UPI00368656F2